MKTARAKQYFDIYFHQH